MVDLGVAGAGGGSVAARGGLVLHLVGARGFLQIPRLHAGKGSGGLIFPVVELGRGGCLVPCRGVWIPCSFLFGMWAFCEVLCLVLVERP